MAREGLAAARPCNSAIMPSSAASLAARSPLVSTTKSARARFSASGIWRASSWSSLASDSPGRCSSRSRCTSGASADDDGGVDQRVGAGLEQQRDLHHGDRRAVLGVLAQERPLGIAHQRMHDRLEFAKAIRSGNQRGAQLGAVDAAVLRRAGERALYRIHRFSTGVEAMHFRVGVEHRQAARAQMCGGCGFAHADRARESDDQH